ncbi:MAG: glycine cleavage system protein T [Candidatus Thorarchaeota archaeon]|nr:MAG: glycine cleavage system protein T [Candidatus Thorarchaeota archaeon]
MSENLGRTHLYDWHKSHGDVIPFAGWEMPVRYTDIREEHMAVRKSVGIFDTTHMFRFLISGPQAPDLLQTVTTNSISKLGMNEGHYSTCLNEKAGIHDDLMIYRIGEQKYIWITNASNGPKIKAHLAAHAKQFKVSVEDKSRDIVMIAVQGPQALTLLSKMAGEDLRKLARFSCNPIRFAGRDCYLCRTGYTGEEGGEILLLDTPFSEAGKKKAISFWEEILRQGKDLDVKPCGLGARDSTRLEAGFVLYGHELNEEITPLEARISYAVKFKVEPHYIGYDALLKQKQEGVTRTRIGLLMIDKGVPREQYPIMLGNQQIGAVTSGGMSPVLDCGIALALVKADAVKEGDTVEVDIKGRLRKARVTGWPFYNPDEYGENRTH